MIKMRKRKGSAFLLVVMVFTLVAAISTLMMTSMQNTMFQVSTNKMIVQATTLSNEAEEAIVTALTTTAGAASVLITDIGKDEALWRALPELQSMPRDGSQPLEKYIPYLEASSGKGYTDAGGEHTMIHYYGDGGTGGKKEVGKSTMRIRYAKIRYYGKPQRWVIVDVVTQVKDKRYSYEEGSLSDNDFGYVGRVMILTTNPEVRLYNLDPVKVDDVGAEGTSSGGAGGR